MGGSWCRNRVLRWCAVRPKLMKMGSSVPASRAELMRECTHVLQCNRSTAKFMICAQPLASFQLWPCVDLAPVCFAADSRRACHSHLPSSFPPPSLPPYSQVQVLGSSVLPSVPRRRASIKPAGADATAATVSTTAAAAGRPSAPKATAQSGRQGSSASGEDRTVAPSSLLDELPASIPCGAHSQAPLTDTSGRTTAAAVGSALPDLLSDGDWTGRTATPAAAAASRADGRAGGQHNGQDRGSRLPEHSQGKRREQQQQQQRQQPAGWASFDDDVTADAANGPSDTSNMGGCSAPFSAEQSVGRVSNTTSESGGDKWHPLMHLGGKGGGMPEQLSGDRDALRQSKSEPPPPEGDGGMEGGEGRGKEVLPKDGTGGGLPGGGSSLAEVLSECLKGEPERMRALAFARLVERHVGRCKGKVRHF